jgi:hypothetical protein
MATKYAKQTFITIPNKDTLQTVGGYAQAVYLWMCSMQNDRGECYPSYSKLGELTGFGRTTVVQAVKTLIEAGILRKTNRTKSKEKLTNLYEVMIIDTEPQTEVDSYTQGRPLHNLHREGGRPSGNLPSTPHNLPRLPGNHGTKPTELNPLNEIEVPEWKRKQQERMMLLQRLDPTGRM